MIRPWNNAIIWRVWTDSGEFSSVSHTPADLPPGGWRRLQIEEPEGSTLKLEGMLSYFFFNGPRERFLGGNNDNQMDNLRRYPGAQHFAGVWTPPKPRQLTKVAGVGWSAAFIDVPEQGETHFFTDRTTSIDNLPSDGLLCFRVFVADRKPRGEFCTVDFSGDHIHIKAHADGTVTVSTEPFADAREIRGAWTDKPTIDAAAQALALQIRR